jgi:hypothetical protein
VLKYGLISVLIDAASVKGLSMGGAKVVDGLPSMGARSRHSRS